MEKTNLIEVKFLVPVVLSGVDYKVGDKAKVTNVQFNKLSDRNLIVKSKVEVKKNV